MVTLRILHVKNQPPRPKTVAYRPRTHRHTDRHTDRESKHWGPLFSKKFFFDFRISFKGAVRLIKILRDICSMVYHAKYDISNISRLTKNCSLFPIFFLSSSSPTTKFEFNRVRKKSWPDIVHWKINWKKRLLHAYRMVNFDKISVSIFPGLDNFFLPFSTGIWIMLFC